jgi:hypothetical protein
MSVWESLNILAMCITLVLLLNNCVIHCVKCKGGKETGYCLY